MLGRDARDRLDKHLQQRFKSVSRHQLRMLIERGGVHVNGEPIKPSHRLKKGDRLEVWLPPRPTTQLRPEPIPLEILYEDEHFIVVNKSAGLIVHPGRGQLTGTLLNGLAHHFQQQQHREVSHEDGTIEGLSTVGAEEARPGVVHRLDRDTTGVMVVAKRDPAHQHLAGQFARRTPRKVYLALVHAQPDPPDPPGGTIEAPIGRHPTVREAMAVRHDSLSKSATTLYRLRERYRGYALLEMEIKTGRTHQIRVHLSYLGHPVAGDLLYGGEPVGPAELVHPPLAAGARPNLNYARGKAEGERLEAAARSEADPPLHRPALHAAMLGLHHPETGGWMEFTAPAPSALRDLINRLRRHHAMPGPVGREGARLDLHGGLFL